LNFYTQESSKLFSNGSEDFKPREREGRKMRRKLFGWQEIFERRDEN